MVILQDTNSDFFFFWKTRTFSSLYKKQPGQDVKTGLLVTKKLWKNVKSQKATFQMCQCWLS